MAIYINGRTVNPIVSFLVSAVVLAGVVALGIVLLPLVGGILLFILLCVLGIALYGVYYRWRYGDPIKRMQEEVVRQMHRRAQGGYASAGNSEETSTEQSSLKKGQVRTGVRRTTTVEDVTVVREIQRREE